MPLRHGLVRLIVFDEQKLLLLECILQHEWREAVVGESASLKSNGFASPKSPLFQPNSS
jgi:hypothetical protein